MESARPRSSGFVAPRRVFTAPAPPSAPQPAVPPQSSGELVDTLYDHPNVKIIAFTAGRAGPDIEPGSLPWSSQLERTLAVGPFRIYRAPGSVAFLSCGSALQPILPKSQVWCVDEESSKFILQIRRPQYWRIEVPIGDDEEIWGAATTDSLPTSEPSATTTATPIHEPDCPTTSAQQQPAGTTQPAVATPTTSGPETPFKTASSTPVPTTPSPSSPSSRGRRPPIRRATTTSSFSSPFSSPSSPHRALSPLPPAANLLTTRRQPPPRAAAAAAMPVPVSVPAASTPVMQNALAAVRRLPMTVLHKTCAILFSPPSYLISLMLKVAARIMAGEWRGLVFGLGEGGERVSVAWDWSDDDEDHGRGGGGGGGGGGDSGLGARGRGWNGSGGDGDGDDFWLRGRTGPGKAKMVGAFPDSDDEDSHEDEAVGPLDRLVVVSPGRKNRGVVSGKAGVVVEQKAVGRLRGKHGKESDSESGVD
ncbi:hypothetical protein CHGG_00389 [Chaetomium globosum CBS 148.51]|uniref:Inheritance of peroxisomes protein 1 n=1 Tax=Chaetomium globosum (strain ATCC 6205 / CBS 148.51 / DSM 1962 / NBRC 6347 / NRRL 1970) TaxID=306901 RepID=Q2HHB5_CHAGB|nr:uncharacterized protein CHGG_00389 [Chaetomium globosum CBS 148.51]EAQ92154.1 hypothetical protein CHGG_00389 [Chaetomium globosum CBS 148.51]